MTFLVNLAMALFVRVTAILNIFSIAKLTKKAAEHDQ